jgi:hypothetical protein
VLPIELSAWLRTASAATPAAALDEFEVDAAAHVVVGVESAGVDGADAGGVFVDVVEDVVPVVDEAVDEGANEIWGAAAEVEVVAVVVAAPVVEGTSGADELTAGNDNDGVVGVPGVALGVVLAIEAGTVVQVRAAAAAGPNTVPATALVVWVPLAVPPAVLMKTSFRVSAFCQYCGAASITTWYWLRGL